MNITNRSRKLCYLGVLALCLPAFAYSNANGRAFVSNQDAGIVEIDLTTMEPTHSIEVGGKGPRGLGVTADGKYLVTANKEDANVAIISLLTRKVVKLVKIGKNPEFVRVMGDRAFVTYEPSSKGAPQPKPGATTPKDEDEVVPAHIAIIDIKKGKLIAEITTGPETEGIEFSPDRTKMIVTNEADSSITVHDIKSGKLLKTISTKGYGDRPRGIKVSPDGKTYVATLEFGNKLLVMNDKFEPIRTVDTGKNPNGIAFDNKGKRIFVAAARENLLQVFDAESYVKIKDIPSGDRCWHFSFTPDDKQLLLACGRSHEILVIDTEKLEITKHIAIKGLPWGVVTYPKAFGSLDKP